MPNLADDATDSQEKTEVHVSMPSLNPDDEENTQSSQEQTEVQHIEGGESIPIDLEELQNAAGDGQLKFIVDENGQILQLDNHILTTDAEGNQILVQGTDQEQLQHLLQSVGVDGNQVLVQLQGNGEEIDGEGATLQMIGGDGNQGQMILVQGADGESQLIDASMLQTEGGNLVLQQGADGETHLTTADGIPVSVSFSEGGEGQITVTMASGHEEGQQIFLQQPMEIGEEAGETVVDANEGNSQDSLAAPATAEDPLGSQETLPEVESGSATENVTSTTEEELKNEAESNDPPQEASTADEKDEEESKADENPTEEKVKSL